MSCKEDVTYESRQIEFKLPNTLLSHVNILICLIPLLFSALIQSLLGLESNGICTIRSKLKNIFLLFK